VAASIPTFDFAEDADPDRAAGDLASRLQASLARHAGFGGGRDLRGPLLAAVVALVTACGDEAAPVAPALPATPPPASASAPAIGGSRPAGHLYFVAVSEPGASDENNGLSPAHRGGSDGPWQTIRHAAEVMQPGDTTQVRAGTYFEAGISFTSSGDAGAPITLAGYPGEEAVIDGSRAEAEGMPGIYLNPGQGHYVIQGLTIRNMGWSGIATHEATTEPYESITIRDCVLANNGRSGIDLAAAANFLVEDVESYGNGYYGMNIGASKDGSVSSRDGVVTRSTFHDHTGPEGHGLAINQGYNITFSDNEAYHNRIHGFDVSDMPKGGESSHDIRAERNLSYDNGCVGFAVNSDSHHVVFRQNVAWRNGAAWASQGTESGFKCYGGCWHVEWDNNTAVENSDAGFWVNGEFATQSTPGDRLLVFKNNIAAANANGAMAVKGSAGTWDVVAMNNDFGPSHAQAATLEDQGQQFTPADLNGGRYQSGNVSVDPLFVDLENQDFHLQVSSPLVDAGTDVGLPFCGAAPDMGAYELCP
jgi:hypothetical protein